MEIIMMMKHIIDMLNSPVNETSMIFWWMVGLFLVLPITAFFGSK